MVGWHKRPRLWLSLDFALRSFAAKAAPQDDMRAGV